MDRAGTHILRDRAGILRVFYANSSKDYPAPLRSVVVRDESGKRIVSLTNNCAFPAETITALYRQRWQVELHF